VAEARNVANEDPGGAEFVAVRAAVRRFGDPMSGGGPNQFDLVHDKQVHRLYDAGTHQQRPESLTRLASDVLSRDHRLMICALDNFFFFFDPGVVPIFFAIDAMLALVGTIIATL
jgi:hypothetical protein